MAKGGLPAKYIKQAKGSKNVMKKAWQLFKAAKRKRGNPSPTKSNPKKGNPKKKKARTKAGNAVRKAVQRLRPRRILTKAQGAAVNTAVGVGGAAVTTLAVNALPIRTPAGRVATQAVAGFTTLAMATKDMPWVTALATGTLLAAGLSTARLIFPAIAVQLAGMPRRLPYKAPLEHERVPERKNMGLNFRPPVGPGMGVNFETPMGRCSPGMGYGPKYLTGNRMYS